MNDKDLNAFINNFRKGVKADNERVDEQRNKDKIESIITTKINPNDTKLADDINRKDTGIKTNLHDLQKDINNKDDMKFSTDNSCLIDNLQSIKKHSPKNFLMSNSYAKYKINDEDEEPQTCGERLDKLMTRVNLHGDHKEGFTKDVVKPTNDFLNDFKKHYHSYIKDSIKSYKENMKQENYARKHPRVNKVRKAAIHSGNKFMINALYTKAVINRAEEITGEKANKAELFKEDKKWDCKNKKVKTTPKVIRNVYYRQHRTNQRPGHIYYDTKRINKANSMLLEKINNIYKKANHIKNNIYKSGVKDIHKQNIHDAKLSKQRKNKRNAQIKREREDQMSI